MPDKRTLSHSTLAKLSGLRRQQLDDFMPTWNELPVAERRRAVRTLIDLAEDNVELDYHDLFRRLIADPDPEVRALAIEGLWAITFGNSANTPAQPSLFFTSGPGGEKHGLFGRLDLAN